LETRLDSFLPVVKSLGPVLFSGSWKHNLGYFLYLCFEMWWSNWEDVWIYSFYVWGAQSGTLEKCKRSNDFKGHLQGLSPVKWQFYFLKCIEWSSSWVNWLCLPYITVLKTMFLLPLPLLIMGKRALPPYSSLLWCSQAILFIEWLFGDA